MSILEKITAPGDLKRLSGGELNILAGEVREKIIQVVSRCGGHLSSNLGAVELTIAMLRSFDLPHDRIIWDVGHQSYAFKLLTGCQQEFEKLRQFNGCCGFPVRGKNEYECYSAGHAGVAISAALGMCAAQNKSADAPGSKVIAFVGDGAIGSGVAWEGLNQVREHGKNLIIILNDNKMAISPNVGALSRSLNRVMISYRYRAIKNCAKTLINLLPKSRSITNFVRKLEDAAKRLLLPSEPFESLGIRYIGPVNGHNINNLERIFRSVARDDRPVIIHTVTEKGRGYPPAEAAPERFHGVGAFDASAGQLLKNSVPGFSAAFGQAACDMAGIMPDLYAVSAAMTNGVGLSEFARKYAERFFDAGMAESHAVSFSSGLAAAGKRVICAIYATFMQRSLDNIFHDVCLQNLPVTFVLDRAGLVEDGPTHHGIYDLGFLLGMPNLIVMQPGCEAEVKAMLEFALNLRSPVAIRYPRGGTGLPHRAVAPIIPGRAAVWREGSDAAIYAVGAEAARAMQIADILEDKYALQIKVVNVRFLKPFDADMYRRDLQKMPVFTLEDHMVDTGFGAIAARAAAGILSCCHYESFGIRGEQAASFGTLDELRKSLQLDSEFISGRIAEVCRGHFTSK